MPVRAFRTSCTLTTNVEAAHMCSISLIIWRRSLKFQNSVIRACLPIGRFIINPSSSLHTVMIQSTMLNKNGSIKKLHYISSLSSNISYFKLTHIDHQFNLNMKDSKGREGNELEECNHSKGNSHRQLGSC